MVKAYSVKNRAVMVGGILCLTLAIASLTGCKSKEATGLNPERIDKTRAAIQTEIPDAERSKAMLVVVDAFDAESQKIIENVTALRLQIAEANRDYDTTREQLQRMYDEIGTQLEQLGQTTKTHSLKLRALCSEAEWDEIFDHDDEAIEFKY